MSRIPSIHLPPPPPMDSMAKQPASPGSPRTPLTPPLTPGSSIATDHINATPHTPTLRHISKSRLPRIVTSKVSSELETPSPQDFRPSNYHLNSPKEIRHQSDSQNSGSHFILLQGVPKASTYHSLRITFQTLRGSTGSQTKHLQSEGVIALAFDDSRDAHSALMELSRPSASSEYFPGSDEKLVPLFCSTETYEELYGRDTTFNEMTSKFLISADLGALDHQMQATVDEDIHNILMKGGELRLFKRIIDPGEPHSSIYLVDFYKATCTNAVFTTLKGKQITFGKACGNLHVEKFLSSSDTITLGRGGRRISIGQNKKTTNYISECISSGESIPALSRRHSTASFHNQRSVTPALASSPVIQVSDASRRLNHSLSEMNLRKKTEIDESTVSSAQAITSEPVMPTQSSSQSTLSPHAPPFSLRSSGNIPSYSFPETFVAFNAATVPSQNGANNYYSSSNFHFQQHTPVVPPGTSDSASPYSQYYSYTPYGVRSYDARHVGPVPNIASLADRHSPQNISPVVPVSTTASHTYYPSSAFTNLGFENIQHAHVSQSITPSILASHDASSHQPSYPSERAHMSVNTANMDSSLLSPSTSANSPNGVPPRNTLDLSKIERGEDTRTTIMLKNIPNKMSDKDLVQFIHDVCPRKIDFLYLRMDFTNHCNVGYAFVNFIEVEDLLFFARQKLGTKWNMFSSEKVLQMSYANYQGKEALLEKFKNSCIMNEREEWRPKAFYSSGELKGLPEPFPAPTHLRRMERSHQTRGPLWGASGPPSSSSQSHRPTDLWTRLRMATSSER